MKKQLIKVENKKNKKLITNKAVEYNPKFHPELIKCYARDGKGREEMARALKIRPERFIEWINTYPEFEEALSEGLDQIDARVENALLKKALGYAYEEVKETQNRSGKVIKRVVHKKQYAPDVNAIMFWLRNRQPKKWTDKINDGATLGVTLVVNGDFAPLIEERQAKTIEKKSVRDYEEAGDYDE